MGCSANQENEKDPNYNVEMKAMMGGKGKPTGERYSALQKTSGKKFKQPESTEAAATKTPPDKNAEADAHSIEWK